MKSSLFFAVTLSLPLYFSLLSANAARVNRTIDDSDALFSYSPMANWQAPDNMSCSACLPLPDYEDTWNSTLHYALHPMPKHDADDLRNSTSPGQPTSGDEAPVLTTPSTPVSQSPAPSLQPSSSPASVPPVAVLPVAAASASPSSSAPPSSVTQAAQAAAAAASTTTRESDGGDGSGDSKGGGKGPSSRRSSIDRRTDADDPNFRDVNITATLNFTGTACYVYCAVPVQSSNTSILSFTNLTFFVDGLPAGQYHHDPSKDTGSSLGYQYQVLVFSKDDLPYAPHVLVIKPALGSVLLLDFVQYTTLDTASITDGGSSAQATPSGYVDSNTPSYSNKKNTTTFGVAIGSTMGVLAVISLAAFISICRRRRRSAKREKRREALEAVLRPDSPEMRGPQPFIPRYFPGVAPPHSSPSPPPFSPLSDTASRTSETGPSHGLDFPPAPEHRDAPAYSPVPLLLTEQMRRIPISLPPATRRVSRDDAELPRYQDVGQTSLVTIPASIHALSIPPSLERSTRTRTPSSQAGSGETLSSSLLLFPDRSDSYQGESTAGHTTISSIHVNPNRRPG